MNLDTCLATREEQQRRLPGDGLVTSPRRVVTHAITIQAPPSWVWPWLVQIGGGRAGWYSYDWIDNGGRPSANRLLPEYQGIAVGDSVPALPGAKLAFRVAIADPPQDFVLVMPGSRGDNQLAWAFHLEPLPGDAARLLMRAAAGLAPFSSRHGGERGTGGAAFAERLFGLLAYMPPQLFHAAGRMGHYIMGSRMLRGIRRRAEARVD